MIDEIFPLILISAVLLSSLVTGLVFGFAIVTMPGIAKLSDKNFLKAFKYIDEVIQKNQPIFMLVWVGSIMAVILTLTLGILLLSGMEKILLLSASSLYLLGVQLPTVFYNIPLNNRIQKLDINLMKDSELEKYKKNQLIKLKILEINLKDEKIRLGIKQLAEDPFDFFANKNVSDIVTGIVQSSAQNGIYLQVGKKNLPILIKKNQLAKEIENQRPSRFVKGDKLDALIVELDKEKRKVSLSIKALEEKQTKEAVKKYGSKDSGGILSDIFDFSKVKTKKPKSKK